MPPVSYSATCNSKGALLRDNLSTFLKAKLVLTIEQTKFTGEYLRSQNS